MARCCGSTGTCACAVTAGDQIEVTGNGSSQDPFVISADVNMAVVDTTVFNLTLTGDGSTASPWTLTVAFAATATLNDVPDVNVTGATNGQVLSWDSGTSTWIPAAPTTAPTGAVTHDTSLTGDGSVGLPLQVNEDPTGGLVTGASGLGLTDTFKLADVRKFANAAARTAATPAPTVNSLTILATTPGVVDYWTGSVWTPIVGQVRPVIVDEFLELSGPYASGAVTLFIKQVNELTDANGQFDVLDAAELASYAGVLSISVQPSGTVPWVSLVTANINSVLCTAYTLDTGIPYASQTLEATVTARLY